MKTPAKTKTGTAGAGQKKIPAASTAMPLHIRIIGAICHPPVVPAKSARNNTTAYDLFRDWRDELLS
ncbi:MAG: hypothetical protein KGQ89_06360 [Verrucomicrobia bacterium]|nr:hypothetical protein [Verrucomicrobiota bacterium]